jgi:hypothetical protein
MPTFALRRFTCPETLEAIAPQRLSAFLRPYESFLQARKIGFPKTASGKFDYTALVDVFLSPDDSTPSELINALYLVDEMSTPDGMDALLIEAERRDLKLGGSEHSPADVAVQIWLLDRELLERKHAEQFLTKVRSFESYQTGCQPAPPFSRPSPQQLAELEQALDNWFEQKKRGRGCRVFVCEKPDGVWLLVRHGEPYKREESLYNREASSVCYRPLKYDVLVYHPETGELRINARSKGEKELYKAQFGQHLFGDELLFPGANKYTLEPLRGSGPASLACSDIPGMESVKLREVQILYSGTPYEVVTRKSTDVFAALTARDVPFPSGGRLIRAAFQIQFANSRSPRTVVIRPANIAQYTRDEDSMVVERWLKARGFIRQEGGEGAAA